MLAAPSTEERAAVEEALIIDTVVPLVQADRKPAPAIEAESLLHLR